MEQQSLHPDVLLHLLLNMGEAMLTVGGEVNRVEDTLSRMGRAYGAQQMNVFVITSSIIVTMAFSDGQELTQTRRIHSPGGTDFRKLEALNALSRRCCAQPVSPEELEKELAVIGRSAPRVSMVYLGSMLAGGSFAVFFGGGAAEGLAAAVFGALICLLQRTLIPACPNRLIFNLLCSFLVSTGICLCAWTFPGLQAGTVMIGDIMLLIPGLAMTNAIRDILVGDTISGVMRLIESLLWAGALAVGFMLGIWLMGG